MNAEAKEYLRLILCSRLEDGAPTGILNIPSKQGVNDADRLGAQVRGFARLSNMSQEEASRHIETALAKCTHYLVNALIAVHNALAQHKDPFKAGRAICQNRPDAFVHFASAIDLAEGETYQFLYKLTRLVM